MSPELEAIRTRVGIRRTASTQLLALRGDDARDALLALCPSRLFLRDAQVKESLLLDEGGRPIADVLVCADDEDYLLMVEGLDAAAVRTHVETQLSARNLSPQVEDVGATHTVMSLHGPWAWQLAASTLGDDMVALPYLNFFRVDAGLCVRAGKTGEFGYELVVKHEAADEVWSSLLEGAAKLEGREVGAEALSLCRFESWFFDPAHVPDGASPLELSMGWRLDFGRDWVGKEALEARRSEGPTRRLSCLLAPSAVEVGAVVTLEGDAVGEVTRAAYSEAREEHVVAALVDASVAHGGVRFAAGEVPLLCVAPPLIDNHSLYVDPRRHTWDARDEITLGPLARGPRALEPV